MRSILGCAAVLLILPLLEGPTPWAELHAQDRRQEAPATLLGEVTSGVTGEPLVNARVLILETERWTLTDPAGRFQIREITPGAKLVQVSYLGIRSDPATVVLGPGRTHGLRITFDLELPPITAEIEGESLPTGKLRGFYERQEREQGYYVTADEIDRIDPMRTTDMLRRVPGVRIAPSNFGRTGITMSASNRRCPIEWYLDGVRTPFLDPDNVPPQDIVGIEIYRGLARVPIEFRHRAQGCGVIVIWTHDPGES